MAGGTEVRRRTGGRSARVVAAVHDALNELVAQGNPRPVTVAEIAERAGVNPTSIYRRWGTLEALVLDVEAARLQVNSPIPDTGTLRGDLLAYATRAAKVYEGIEPLTGEDIAETLVWCASRPAHVCIDEILIKCTAQAAIHKVDRRPAK